MDTPIICPYCEREIDPEVCHCGSARHFHGWELGHSFVPMGCECGYAQTEKTADE